MKTIDDIKDMLNMIPPHSGTTFVGCERAIRYLKNLEHYLILNFEGDHLFPEEEAENLLLKIRGYVDKLESAQSEILKKQTGNSIDTIQADSIMDLFSKAAQQAQQSDNLYDISWYDDVLSQKIGIVVTLSNKKKILVQLSIPAIYQSTNETDVKLRDMLYSSRTKETEMVFLQTVWETSRKWNLE